MSDTLEPDEKFILDLYREIKARGYGSLRAEVYEGRCTYAEDVRKFKNPGVARLREVRPAGS